MTALREFIATTAAPARSTARVVFIHADLGSEPKKLGSYGTTKGARDFLGLVYTPGAPLDEEFAAYYFEQVILFCTSLGLGTVWLAGFTHGAFDPYITLQPSEKLIIASPVGYPGDSKPIMARIGLANFEKMHATKKPFEALFCGPGFVPLIPEAAGEFRVPLEMVRLGPSAMNKQSFRILVDGQVAHFYVVPASVAHLDVGIAMCHFEQTALQQGLTGAFEVLPDAPSSDGLEYVVTWQAGDSQ